MLAIGPLSLDLAAIWFLLVGVLLVGYAILDGFDLGVGSLHLLVARTDDERRTLMTSIGPVWDGNEVWLLTAGGALFAAFPLVYATVFSGFYIALMLVLFALIFRAVALEFRGQLASAGWRRAWDVAFFLGSLLPALLFGVALGNIARGLPLDASGSYTGGLLGLLDPFTLLVGLTGLAMLVMQGSIWLVVKTEGRVHARARIAAFSALTVFGVLWVVTTVASRAAAPHLWDAYGAGAAWLVPAVFLVALLAVPVLLRLGRAGLAFVASSVAIGALFGILGIGLYPTIVPSTGAGTPLTLDNASSSDLTLGAMLVIALIGMPLVLAYTAFVYHRFRGKTRLDEAGHAY